MGPTRTAIVTGASSGIGRVTALALAGPGIRVAAVARRLDLLEGLAKQAPTSSPPILPIQADVTDGEQVAAAVTKIQQAFGQIDVLINNAGVEITGPIDQVSDEVLDSTLDVNLKGAILFTRAVVPAMRSQQSGLIINIASTAGQRGFADDAVYCAAKYGVVGFSDALNEELRRYGIRVCCISPGAVNTDLAKNTWSPPDDPYRPYYLQADDVARAIEFVVQQSPLVTIESIVMRPSVEPPYSPPLPLEVWKKYAS